jgi:predicted GNAT family N-acyltransferase
MTLKFRKYSWQLAPQDIRKIRQRVFIDEQQVPPELEWDSTDEIADHYLAVLPDNTPAGVARLFTTLDETAHIGRMAILPEFRGRGIGQALLRHLVCEAAGSYRELRLSAQEHAIPFYQQSGFHVCSDFYDDAGIPHADMRCLAPARIASAYADTTADPQSQTQAHPLILGQDPDTWPFSSEADMASLTDSVVGQARQRVWLYDQLLDHNLYGRFCFRELISALARRHPLSDVRLLIHDDKPLVKRRHAIVELMRRIPSRIQLRLVNSDYPAESQPFILADQEGIVYRHNFEKPEGFAGFSHSRRVKLLSESYLRMWEAGTPSAELRELPI